MYGSIENLNVVHLAKLNIAHKEVNRKLRRRRLFFRGSYTTDWIFCRMIHWFRNSHIGDSNQKIRPRAMAAHSVVFFLVYVGLHQADSVFGCTVTPSAAAIFAGTNISVACRPTSGENVTRWRRQNEDKTVYFAQSAQTNRYVADGYFVNDSNTKEIILTLVNASIQYVDNYECRCLNPPDTVLSGYTNITVIETEPQFFANSSLSSDDPVRVLCSLKLAGNASVLMQITNSDGKVFAELNQRISTNVSQQFNLPYNISSVCEKMYFCNISLANDGGDLKTTIFSRSLTRTVQFSVRNVSISPELSEHCKSEEFCKKNSVILCTAKGSPEPNYNFTIYRNGTIVRFLANQQKYTIEYVGQQIIQCTAFNEINGIVYSNSINFTTNVTEASISLYSAGGPNVPLIVGLVVGLGGGLLILIIILILIYFKRQKRRTACCNLEQSSEAKPEDAIGTKDSTKGNKGNNTNINGQTNLAAISGDERVLVDNALYSGAKGGVTYSTAIDPSGKRISQ